MHTQSRSQLLFSFVLALFFSVVLTGCGGGGTIPAGSDTTSGGTGVTTLSAQTSDEIQLTGSVGDGPVVGANIEVRNAQGELIDTLRSDNTASFDGRLRVKRANYPLTLKVVGGTDLVTGRLPDFHMYSVVTGRKQQITNINPFSTLIVKIAQLLPGGLTTENIATARGYVMQEAGYGLNTAEVADPITTAMTDANIADLVKASEALGEMVRRTRDQLKAAGRNVNGDAVLQALAVDLQDGQLDGRGGGSVDTQMLAVARVVSGQVLVEALSNNLKVDGVVATGVIDQSIRTTHPGISDSALTHSVRITSDMLQQTRTAIAAAAVLDTSAEVIGLDQTVSQLSAGMSPGSVANVLPASASRALDNATVLVVTADDTQIEAVNTATAGSISEPDPSSDPASTEPPPPAPNTAPVISGTPLTSIEAGSTYSYQPQAQDADGDSLSFTISGKPQWAGFNSTNGRLSGTPGAGDTGIWANIVISVTDGTDTAALPAFSIDVVPAPVTTGSFSLSWAAPVARTDGTSLSLADIDGYRILYGSTSGQYTETLNVNDGSAQGATISNLASGNWYVVMTTVDNAGRESARSSEVVKLAQ